MSKRRIKNYSLEFKQSSAKLAAESDQTISATARDLGVNETTLHGWVRRYCNQPKATDPKISSDMQSELKSLRKEVIKLRLERDILKKAAAYFARETQ